MCSIQEVLIVFPGQWCLLYRYVRTNVFNIEEIDWNKRPRVKWVFKVKFPKTRVSIYRNLRWTNKVSASNFFALFIHIAKFFYEYQIQCNLALRVFRIFREHLQGFCFKRRYIFFSQSMEIRNKIRLKNFVHERTGWTKLEAKAFYAWQILFEANQVFEVGSE